MISYGKQFIDNSDIDAVVEVLKSDWLTQGPHVESFETELNKYFGSLHACANVNGTASLHLVSLALGWKKDDIIITSPITFLATVNCISYSGATVDFADIDAATFTIDPNQIEEKIKSYISKGKNVKALIGVDYAGYPCDWESLRFIADKYDLQLVNDNCHALGASYLNDKQYAVIYAVVITQSYHPVKHITTGEGGAVLTNDSSIDEKVRLFRNHGMVKDPDKLERREGPWYYEMHEIGYNYRITDFQCALGKNQLKKLDNFVNKRRRLAKHYDKLLSNINNLFIPNTNNKIRHSYHLYPLCLDFNKLKLSKSDIFDRMKSLGVNLQVHYIPVHLQPYYRKRFGFNLGDFPISEKFYNNEISLPIYPYLNILDQEKICNSLIALLNE